MTPTCLGNIMQVFYFGSMRMSRLDQVLRDIKTADDASKAKLEWNPGYQGSIDIRIAVDGSWYHDGRQFQRDALTKLFASVLRREGENYYLVTPTEKLQIQVDDAPFVATLVEQEEESEDRTAIVFETNIGEQVVVDRHHPIRVEFKADTGEPRPYVHVRAGLEALISRSAFYDLLGMAEEIQRNQQSFLVVTSMGERFELGRSDE
ncbi:MAG: DUF1285 domain-containing protein [Gammaproteobacteria bacterium]|nr:DUF1285 domain-containing protein [Gammaproteobacteria bacterium]